MGNLHIFGNDNINRRLFCSSIGIGIGNGNGICFLFRYYNCNDNHLYIGGILVLSVPMTLYYITCIEEVFITGTLYTFGKDNTNYRMLLLYWYWDW